MRSESFCLDHSLFFCHRSLSSECADYDKYTISYISPFGSPTKLRVVRYRSMLSLRRSFSLFPPTFFLPPLCPHIGQMLVRETAGPLQRVSYLCYDKRSVPVLSFFRVYMLSQGQMLGLADPQLLVAFFSYQKGFPCLLVRIINIRR